jgi:hypothetical protein
MMEIRSAHGAVRGAAEQGCKMVLLGVNRTVVRMSGVRLEIFRIVILDRQVLYWTPSIATKSVRRILKI